MDFALANTVRAGGEGYQIHGRRIRLLCYADDAALFAESRAELLKSVQAVAIALAAVGVRLNASKSYYVRSPWATGESTMSFVALDSDGTLRKQAITTVDPAGAARYLGVWFSFTGPADGEYEVRSLYPECTGGGARGARFRAISCTDPPR